MPWVKPDSEGLAPGLGEPCYGTSAKDGTASDRERGCPVGVMCVEAAFAFGAEKMGDAYGLLSQDELELVCPAFRADLADAAESQYVKRLFFIVEVVDDHARVEFAEDQVVVGEVLSSARWLGLLLGWGHRFR